MSILKSIRSGVGRLRTSFGRNHQELDPDPDYSKLWRHRDHIGHYPGISRSIYAALLGASLVVALVAGQAAHENGDKWFSDGGGSLYRTRSNFRMYFTFISTFSFLSLISIPLRVVNIVGDSDEVPAAIGCLAVVPVVNLAVIMFCLTVPTGYADHRQLDSGSVLGFLAIPTIIGCFLYLLYF